MDRAAISYTTGKKLLWFYGLNISISGVKTYIDNLIVCYYVIVILVNQFGVIHCYFKGHNCDKLIRLTHIHIHHTYTVILYIIIICDALDCHFKFMVWKIRDVHLSYNDLLLYISTG